MLRCGAPTLPTFLWRRLTTHASRIVTGSDGLPLSIEITRTASQRIKTLGGRDLRVAVDSGGCHGFQYQISIDSATPEDVVFERDGARVVVDETSLPLLTGSTIDYKSELIGSAFCVVGNPAADSGCGCGVSFNLKK